MRKYIILLGNFLEFYEFTLFATLLPIIAPILFPSGEIVNSFAFGYGFLAIGFLGRPIGALLFGYIGDKYGRRKAMILSISLMSIATIGISVLPTSESIGVYAFILLAICRIFQGLSAGGEYSGAGLLLVENSTKEKQFFNGAILTFSALSGAFVAALISATINISIFPKESWRILFFIGGVLGIFALISRLSFQDIVITRKQKEETKHIHWSTLFTKYRLQFFYCIIFGALMNVPFQMITGFINTYFIATGLYSKGSLMFINAFVIAFCAVVTLGFGFLSTIINPLKMMFCGSLGMALFSFPFFFLIESGSFYLFIFAELMLILLSQFFVAPTFTTTAKLFPYRIRYKAVAMGNCIGLAFLGGATPYISAKLIKYTGSSYSPAYYLFLISVMGFFAVVSIILGKQKVFSLDRDYNLKHLEVIEA
jgi:MFS family permease